MIEIPVDPHSKFWEYHERVDAFGDPLDLVLMCEEIDQVEGNPRWTTYHEMLPS